MNKLLIYINILFFLVFQTISSAEWITKKSNKYEKITEIENMYSEGFLSKFECEQAKSKILKTKDRAKTNCDNIKVYSASSSNDTEWDGKYEWNGQTVSKEYYCRLAKQNNMHKYYKEDYKLKCGSSSKSSSYITKKTKDKKRIICTRGTTAFWYEPGNCSRSNDNMIHPNHSMYEYFYNMIKDKETTKETIIVKKEPKQKEIIQSENFDKDPPIIKIAKTITVNDSFYILEGKVSDKSDRIFVLIDGRTYQAKNGKFSIKRFSPVDEKINIVAIDKWGNKSKTKTVNVIVDIKETEIAEKLEPLNPSMIKAKANNNRVALIVGIEKYEDSPVASYANMDAKFFYEYARKAFGVSISNTKLLIDEDASEKAILKVVKKWLPAKINRNTELIIFFAGHGLASNDGKELYILPHDTDTDLLEDTAISRSKLYEDIIKLKPKKVVMFMDTCYSGISRDEKTLLASARPLRLLTDESEGDMPSNFTVFSASQISQMSSGLKEAKHGIFSYYLMKGLEGKADQNSDKKITNGELLDYMNEQVAMKAAELGRTQNPSLLGDRNKVLITYN